LSIILLVFITVTFKLRTYRKSLGGKAWKENNEINISCQHLWFDRLNINSTYPPYTLDFQEPFATFD
jgi:hypothetical protein